MSEVTAPTFESSKDRRRREAQARQAEHDKLTIDQKIAKAKPGSQEHKRLLAKKERDGQQEASA